MSNLRSPESDLMKNLSANEKRKLLRHIDHSQQGSPKKSNSQPAAAMPKGFNGTPKPFGGSGDKPTQVSKISSRWGSSSPVQSTGAKSSSSNVVTKPVKPPNGKSGKVIEVPVLNADHVKMFNAQDSANKFKDVLKKSSNSPVNRSSPTPRSDGPAKFTASPPAVFSSGASSHPVTKVSPLTKAASANNPKVSSPFNVASNKNVSGTSSNPTSVSKQSNFGKKSVNPPISGNKAKQPPLVHQKSTPSNINKHVVKPALKEESVKAPPSAKPSIAKQSSQLSSQPSAASKPPLVWQQRVEPLSKDKPANKVSPPTAVVTPIQDSSKRVVSTKAQQNSEALRQRSVSTPVAHQQPANLPTYTAPNQNVMLPDPSIAKKNSVMANEVKMKRSFSEASKVAAQAKESGKNKKLGHNFQPHELKDWVNWCDACGSVILSLFGKCVSCTKCKMVCHGKCALAVSLTCEADQHQAHSLTLTDSALSFYKTIVQETKDESTLKEYNTIQRVISIDEVQERIEEFNQTVKGSQQMTLQEDGETFRGFIRVSMNLTRPVSVVDSSSKTVRKASSHQRKASFYIDKGALKALHLTSDTTSEQVVKALLMKYSISDNPMKFALFEKQVREEGHVILRKMLPRERPLFLRLLWGNGSSDKRGFILQENESRDIHWESFSIAELQMFIKILDKEEHDYVLEIKRKYKNKSQDIKNAMEHQTKLARS